MRLKSVELEKLYIAYLRQNFPAGRLPLSRRYRESPATTINCQILNGPCQPETHYQGLIWSRSNNAVNVFVQPNVNETVKNTPLPTLCANCARLRNSPNTVVIFP